MATSLLIEERIEIPLRIQSFEQFRRWALSDEFPENGRIDYLDGRIEVDMPAEDLFCHSSPKAAIIAGIWPRVRKRKLGHLFADRARVSSVAAGFSVEPDIVFVSYEAIASGSVTLTPKSGARKGRYVELQGAIDLIIEIVSDSSIEKDTRRLPRAYCAAGVREFWLVDARRDDLIFHIHRRGTTGFRRVRSDTNGFQRSAVLGCSYRFEREKDAAGFWIYELQDKRE
jgi:Uma2 family endonuclease